MDSHSIISRFPLVTIAARLPLLPGSLLHDSCLFSLFFVHVLLAWMGSLFLVNRSKLNEVEGLGNQLKSTAVKYGWRLQDQSLTCQKKKKNLLFCTFAAHGHFKKGCLASPNFVSGTFYSISSHTLFFFYLDYHPILKETLGLCQKKTWGTLFDGASQVLLMVENIPANAGDKRDTGSIPGLGRSPGGGHGNPLQYSCLENSLGQRSMMGHSP